MGTQLRIFWEQFSVQLKNDLYTFDARHSIVFLRFKRYSHSGLLRKMQSDPRVLLFDVYIP